MRILYILAVPLGFLWRHKRIAVLLIVVCAGLLIFNSSRGNNRAEMLPYQEVPGKLSGLDVFQTSTRHYYVVSSTEDDNNYYLNDFYTFDKKWIRYTDVPLQLPKTSVKIYKK